MTEVERVEGLKRLVEKARSRAERAAGAYEALLLTLKGEWGCDSLEAAQAKLEKMQKKAAQKRTEFLEKLKAFEERWGDELKRIENTP